MLNKAQKCPVPSLGGSDETAGVCDLARRRGIRVSLCRASAAIRSVATRRRSRGQPIDLECVDRRVRGATARTRVDRGPHYRDRISLVGRPPRGRRRSCCRVRPAEARRDCHLWRRRACIEADDNFHPHCFCHCPRSAWRRPCAESFAPGRERYGLVDPTDRYERQAARGFARNSPWPASARDHV